MATRRGRAHRTIEEARKGPSARRARKGRDARFFRVRRRSLADRRFSSQNDLDPTSAPRFFLSWRPSSPARFAPSPPHERAPSVPRPLPSRSEGISSGVRPASRARHALPILAPRVSPPPPDPINAVMFRGSFAPRAAKLGNAAAGRRPGSAALKRGPGPKQGTRRARGSPPDETLSTSPLRPHGRAPPPSGRARMMDSKPLRRAMDSIPGGAARSHRRARANDPPFVPRPSPRVFAPRARRSPPPAARASPLSLAPRLGADRRPSPPPPHARRRSVRRSATDYSLRPASSFPQVPPRLSPPARARAPPSASPRSPRSPTRPTPRTTSTGTRWVSASRRRRT